MVTSWSRRCRPISTRLDEWHVGHVIVNPLFSKEPPKAEEVSADRAPGLRGAVDPVEKVWNDVRLRTVKGGYEERNAPGGAW
jgi:hypothetical protein